jgi:peptidoglycan/LPS O-acetylase OafA/YrhL
MHRQELQSPPKSLPNIPALTGLRFFAAFFILFAHSVDWIAQFQDNNLGARIAFVSMYGMPLFFVLSGFVIHYNYRGLFIKESIGRAVCEFAAARFARLYPLFFVFFLLAIAADNFFQRVYNDHNIALPVLLYYLTLTQTWWYLIYEGQSIIYVLFSVSWSISTEMYFYLVYAVGVFFIILAICRRGGAVRAAVGYTVLAASVLWLARYELGPLLAWSEHHVPDYIPFQSNFEHSFYRWFFYFSPYVRVLEFILGCFAAEAFLRLLNKQVSRSERRWANLALTMALIYLGVCALFYQAVFDLPLINAYAQFYALNFLCAPAIGVVLFCVARYDTVFARLMAAPALIALGETSYSIYLVHTWTLRLFERPAPNLTPFWAVDTTWRIACAIGFTLLVSYASYRLIELPTRIWLRRRLRRGISRVFEGRQPHSQPGSDPVASFYRPRSARLQIVYSGLALSGLLVIAFIGQAVRSEQLMVGLHRFLNAGRPRVEVVSASYGANCQAFAVQAPFPNLASPGNATVLARRACDGKTECDLEVSVDRFGDPANGCGKDFLVEYHCSGRPGALSGYLPGEADGRHILLQCPARVSISAGTAGSLPVSHTQ